MPNFDHHQDTCHTLELPGSATCNNACTIENVLTSDCKENNNSGLDQTLLPVINMSASIPEFIKNGSHPTKSESEIDEFFRSAYWITNELVDQIFFLINLN